MAPVVEPPADLQHRPPTEAAAGAPEAPAQILRRFSADQVAAMTEANAEVAARSGADVGLVRTGTPSGSEDERLLASLPSNVLSAFFCGCVHETLNAGSAAALNCESPDGCPSCLNQLAEGDQIIRAACLHVTHKTCFLKWADAAVKAATSSNEPWVPRCMICNHRFESAPGIGQEYLAQT